MSQENVEVVRHSIEVWNQRDMATWIGLLSRDAELDWSRSRSPFKGVYRGRGEHEVFWEVFWSTFADVRIEPHEFMDVGSEVVVWNTAHMRGREGIEVVARSALVDTVQDGLITRLRLFQERAEALEAVGLSEQAMSQENVEILRSGFDQFARGDVDAVLERLDPDVDWRPAIAPILGMETIRGREAVREFLTRDLFEGFDEFRAEPLAYEDLGDAVLVTVRYRGRGESSGLEIDQTFISLYRLREGKTVSMRDYSTRAEALEAARLSE